MKYFEYLKSLAPEDLAKELGQGKKRGENLGCAECGRAVVCEGCSEEWLKRLNEEA